MKKLFSFRVAALVLGLTLAVFGSAFKAGEVKSATNAQRWFLYEGGDVESPDSYTEIGSQPTECSGEGNLCAILTEEDANTGKPTEEGIMNPSAVRQYD
jgi:hypothetical protein